MKKLFLLMLCMFSIVFCTSCSDDAEAENSNNNTIVDKYEGKSGKVTCKLETEDQNFEFIGTYNITYEDGYVTEIYTREVMNMSDEESLKNYLGTLKAEYSKYDDLEYYEYSINSSTNKVINNSYIDYKNIDMELLASIDEEEKIEKDELKVSTILASYKILGAICEEE